MIHSVIIAKIVEELNAALITAAMDIADPEDPEKTIPDPAKAGFVGPGPLQGDPDPDVARISVTVHENDPDALIGGGIGSKKIWDDEPIDEEMGSGKIVTTWSRKFTVKARCLLEGTHENLDTARKIASTVRSRIEKCLREISFSGVATEDEYVSQGINTFNRRGETIQSGGPPDAYDFHIKFMFELWTTEI